MSEASQSGVEGEQVDPVAEEFEFYYPFARTLALDLTSPEDTAIAAAWIQKLEAEPESEQEKLTRLNYLKLLLFALQRGRLSGIFRKQPPDGALQPFPQGMSLLDLGNLMLDQDDMPSCGEGDARCVPYTIEVSNDLREFVASQEVPNFGIQMYYAWSSDEPVHKWPAFDEDKFPRFVLDKIKLLKEIKSEEKSTILKNVSETKKNICDLTLTEKCSRRRVKSPQEIESSQGRSFHTYMGLVEQMGNFDKCEENLGRGQRQDLRMGRSQKGNGRCAAGNGGGNQQMVGRTGLNNAVKALGGGLNIQNRVVFCACPNQQANNPPQQFPDEDQPSNCPQHFLQECQQPPEGQQAGGGRITYDGRPGLNSSQYVPAAKRLPSRPHHAPQCLEKQGMPGGGFNQQVPEKRPPTPQPKTFMNAMGARPPQDNAGGSANGERVCVCSSPCTCPCPRKPSAPCGGRIPGSGNYNVQGAEGACGRKGKNFLHNSQAPGPSGVLPEDCIQDYGGRISVGSRRPRPVYHCYDAQNPDPNIVQQFGTPSMGGPCLPTGGAGQRPQTPVGPSTCQRPPSPYNGRPPAPQEFQQQCSPKQQAPILSQQCPQNFQDGQGAGPQQNMAPMNAVCSKPSQGVVNLAALANRRRKGPCGSDGPYGGTPMEDVLALLRGIEKMKILHRMKRDGVGSGGPTGGQETEGAVCQEGGQPEENDCVDQAPPSGPAQANYSCGSKSGRSPVFGNNNEVCDQGSGAQDPAAGQACNACPTVDKGTGSPFALNQPCQRHKVSSSQAMQPCTEPYANAQQDECDADEEDEVESESSESEDACQEENVQNYDVQPCPAQKSPGRSPQQVAFSGGEMQPAVQQGGSPGKQKICTTLWSGAPKNVSPKGNQGQIQQFDERLNMQPEMQNCVPQNMPSSGGSPTQAQPNYGDYDTHNDPKMISFGPLGSHGPAQFPKHKGLNMSGCKPTSGKEPSVIIPQDWEDLPSSVSQLPDDPGKRPGSKGRQNQYSESAQGGRTSRRMNQVKEGNEWYDFSQVPDMTNAGATCEQQNQIQAAEEQTCPPGPQKSSRKSPKKAAECQEENHTFSSYASTAPTKSNVTPTHFPLEYLYEVDDQQQGPAGQCSPQPAPTEQCSPQRACMRQSSPRQASVMQISPRQAPNMQGSPRQAQIRQGSPQPFPMRQSSPQQIPFRQASPQPAPVRQGSPRPSPVRQGSPFRNPVRSSSPYQTPMRVGSPYQSPGRQSGAHQVSLAQNNSPLPSVRQNEPEGCVPQPMATMVISNPKQVRGSRPGTPQNSAALRLNAGKTPLLSSQKKQVKCFTPVQMADLKNYVQEMNEPEFPRYENNPYVERSMLFQRVQSPGIKNSTACQWKGAITQDSFSDVTDINVYDSSLFNPNEQIQQATGEDENDDGNCEFMPLFSMNADCNVKNLFNQGRTSPRNPEFRQSAICESEESQQPLPAENEECQQSPPVQDGVEMEQLRSYYQGYQSNDFYDGCYNGRGYY